VLKINSNFVIFGELLSPYIMLNFVGLCMGVIIALIICKKRSLQYNFIFRMIISVLFIGVISAVYVSYIPRFMLSFSYVLGLTVAVFLFGLIGKVFHKNWRDCCEIGLIAVSVFMTFSKIGCFFAGCCHGKPYKGVFPVIYSANSHALLHGVQLFPIQLAEALMRILVIGFMLILYYKDIFRWYRLPLLFCLTGNCYFWGMFFWYEPLKTINQNGINYVLIFNVLFGIGTLICVCLQLLERANNPFNKSYN
jgi:hypothetical protein